MVQSDEVIFLFGFGDLSFVILDLLDAVGQRFMQLVVVRINITERNLMRIFRRYIDTNHSNLGRFRIGIERTVQAILEFLRTLLCGNVKSVLMCNTMHWAFDVRQVDLVR